MIYYNITVFLLWVCHKTFRQLITGELSQLKNIGYKKCIMLLLLPLWPTKSAAWPTKLQSSWLFGQPSEVIILNSANVISPDPAQKIMPNSFCRAMPIDQKPEKLLCHVWPWLTTSL